MTAEASRRVRRLGPRPLPLHLGIAAATWLGSAAVLPILRRASPASRTARPPGDPDAPPANPFDALLPSLASADPDALTRAVDREARRRLDAFLRGVETWRAHRFERAPSPSREIWREGTTRLLDFAPGSDGLPLLVVPSLINRYYVLDLLPERSLLADLAARGFRPLAVDWDAPGDAESGFGLDDYVRGRLARALDATRAATGRAPALIGYCMGGLLALPLALARPRDIVGLALLATPWDFHAERAESARAAAAMLAPWREALGEGVALPVDALQAMFAALDPFLAVRKFTAFAALDAESPKAREFVALEDWLNDGVPLAGKVAQECLVGWYGENLTGTGRWRLGDLRVNPSRLRCPTLAVVPAQDRIVPPASAAALARAIPGAETLTPALGHIGMVASARAPATLWPALGAWLGRLAPPGGARL